MRHNELTNLEIVTGTECNDIFSTAQRLWLQNVFDVEYFVGSNGTGSSVLVCNVRIIREKRDIVRTFTKRKIKYCLISHLEI